jgi:hypothetical protein
MGNLLEFSSAEYVNSLHRGVVLVLIAMILRVIVSVLGIVGMITVVAIMSSTGAAPPALMNSVQIWMFIILLPISGMTLIGWWLFSRPDPAIMGAETGQRPRMIIRVTVSITGLAETVQFFASVLYIKWLAPRIPDKALADKAKTYLWLLPLIYVLGAICVGLGPIAASIIYLLMLNTVRMRLQSILKRNAYSREVTAASS